MRPYRILSVGWTTLCVFGGIFALIQFLYLRSLEDMFPEPIYWSAFVVLIYATGVVASIFLDRGVIWARMAICAVAVFSAVVCGFAFVDVGSPYWLRSLLAFIVFYSMISITIFLIPKRYVA
jgi:hypothetical protein